MKRGFKKVKKISILRYLTEEMSVFDRAATFTAAAAPAVISLWTRGTRSAAPTPSFKKVKKISILRYLTEEMSVFDRAATFTAAAAPAVISLWTRGTRST